VTGGERLGRTLLFALMGLVIAAAVLGPLHRTFLQIPTDNNEGWNAYHAAMALSGATLYPLPDSFISTNYPPLSFYFVGLTGRWTGDPIVAGRLISLLGLAITCINLRGLARALGVRHFFSTFAATLFLLYVAVNASGYVDMDDPQWLGHALVTTGALLLLAARTRARPLAYLLLSSLLCTAAVLVKQNLVVLPLALFVWSLIGDRRGLPVWTASSLLLATACVATMVAVFGSVSLQDIFMHQRVISLRRFDANALRYLMPMTPLVLYAALLAALAWRDANARFALLYAAIAGACGCFFLSGDNCDVNVLFDFLLALCLCAVLLAERLIVRVETPHRAWAGVAMAAVIASVCLPTSAQSIEASAAMVRSDRHRRADYQALIATLARAEGPVACEMTSLCYWAGRRFELDSHNYLMKIKRGGVSDAALRGMIDGHHFAYILATQVSDSRVPTASMFGDDLSRDVQAHYAPVMRVEDQVLLAPRP
jgi:hypothetical protein